jgi:hypothetical protein
MKSAKHSGKLGDIVYSLPTLRQLGIRRLYINEHPVNPGDRLPLAHICQLMDVLRTQAYLDKVQIWRGEQFDLDLDRFREFAVKFPHMYLPECHWRGAKGEGRLDLSPWLSVEPKRVASVIFARSLRYQPQKPFKAWHTVPRKDGGWVTNLASRLLPFDAFQRKDAVFVGLAEEYATFEGRRQIPWYRTKTISELASVIAGSDRFIGMQGLTLALTQALGKPHLIEANEDHPCCQMVA